MHANASNVPGTLWATTLPADVIRVFRPVGAAIGKSGQAGNLESVADSRQLA